MAKWLLACLLAVGTAASAQTIKDFFDDTTIQNIVLTMDPNDWNALRQNYLDDTYYKANFAWNGYNANVGVRSRGNGSRSPVKPNLDVKIDKYVKHQTFYSVSFFVLEANNQDASNLRDAVAFKLFTKMGFPAPRVTHARVYVNGTYFGFYDIIEHEDEDFLTRNFGESGGYLYEWQPVAAYNYEYLGSDPALYAPFLELKTNQSDPDAAWLAALITAINKSSDAEFIAAVSPYLNLKLWLAHVAVENIIGEVDGTVNGLEGTNNFFIYRFQDGSPAQLIVWDKDLSFINVARDIMDPTTTNVLFNRLMANAEYRAIYLDAIAKTAATLGGPGGWGDQEVARQYALIHDAAINDPNKQCPSGSADVALVSCGVAEFEAASQLTMYFVQQRLAVVQGMLAANGYTPPAETAVTGAAIAAPNGPQVLVPGTLVNVAIANLPAATGATYARTFSTSSTNQTTDGADSVFVAVNGVRASIVSVVDGQATIQVPWDIPYGTATLVASVGGQTGNSMDSYVATVAPGILAVTNANGSSGTANPGDVITVWALGLGDTGAYFSPGVPAPLNALYRTVAPSVTIGGVNAPAIFSGLAPGFVGLYQVNFTVPNGLKSGTNTFEIGIGGQNATGTIDII